MEKIKTIILGSYFSLTQHPQFGDPHLEGVENDGRVKQEDIKYFERWYNSLKNFDVEGIIFYDNLSECFVNKYSCSNIKFLKAEAKKYVYNVQRFFCYREYLKQNKCEYVFFTDISDVTIANNPEELFKTFPDVDFFLGKDSIKLYQFPYLNFHEHFKWDNYFNFFINQFDWDLINCGVIGCKYNLALSFLNEFCRIKEEMNSPQIISDMFITNYLIRQVFSNKKSLIGEPVTSNFKKYETHRKDIYFIHK